MTAMGVHSYRRKLLSLVLLGLFSLVGSLGTSLHAVIDAPDSGQVNSCQCCRALHSDPDTGDLPSIAGGDECAACRLVAQLWQFEVDDDSKVVVSNTSQPVFVFDCLLSSVAFTLTMAPRGPPLLS